MKLTPRKGKEEENSICDRNLIFNNSQLNVKFFSSLTQCVNVFEF